MPTASDEYRAEYHRFMTKLSGQFSSITDTSEPPKAIQGGDIKNSQELREQIESAITAIEQDLWMLDSHICDCEAKLSKSEKKDFQDDKMFFDAQLYWLKGLLKVAHIELARNQDRQPSSTVQPMNDIIVLK